MDNYKFYRKDNYIVLSNEFTKETFYGFVKEVLVGKSNLNKPHYRFFNIKDWNSDTPLLITQLLEEDGSPYTQIDFEEFYRQNTGNFNGGGTAPGVQSVTGAGVDNTDPQNPVITEGSQGLQQVLDNGNTANKELLLINNSGRVVLEPTNGLMTLKEGDSEMRYSSEAIASIGITGNLNVLSLNGRIAGGAYRVGFDPNKPVGTYVIATTDELVPEINIVADGNFVVPNGAKTRMITTLSADDQIITLPSVANSIGSIYFITNESSDETGVVTVSGTLFDGGEYVSTKILAYGMSLRFFNDGRNFKIIG